MTDKHSDFRARDPLNELDETVAQITDDHIEARLRETLRRAGRRPATQQDDGSLADPDVLWLMR